MRKHTPVLYQETLDMMPAACRFVMDGTLGHGGHTKGMIERMKADTKTPRPVVTPLNRGDSVGLPRVVGVDRDEAMIAKAEEFLGEEMEYVQIVQGSYAELERISQESGVEKFDFILLDIGVNMDHFKEGDRGFSLKRDGELDMRYDRSQGLSAKDWLERVSYDEFLGVLEAYTDFNEKFRKWVVSEFLVARKKQAFTTTQELRARASELGINDKKLAVLFQAIRIEVNGELEELKLFLHSFVDFSNVKGRCAIITYHSIEDRIVKYAFKELVDQGVGSLVNKKVIKPDRKEVQKNKAARSAKLRVFELH